MRGLRAVVFGEVLVDQFPDRRVVAGAPLHVALHLASRGWDTRLVSRVGDDPDGREIRRLLEERGVDTTLLETDPELPTGTVTVHLRGSDHSFVIHRPAAWDEVRGPDHLPDHQAFCFTGLAARSPVARASLERLLAASVSSLRVFDLTFRPPDVHPDAVRGGLALATLVKGNEEELDLLVELLGLHGWPAGVFAAAPEAAWVCVTRGERGACLYARQGRTWEVQSRRARVVDTVGAGDAFTAALVDCLARGKDEEEALTEAVRASAAIVSQRGGLPPGT